KHCYESIPPNLEAANTVTLLSSEPNADPSTSAKFCLFKSKCSKEEEQVIHSDEPKRKTLAVLMKDELKRVARLTAERFMEATVAFAPTKEAWMPEKLYREAGTSYLLGHVTRYGIESAKMQTIFPFLRLHSKLHCISKKNHVHIVSESIVTRGIRNFATLPKGSLQFVESWTSLCCAAPQLTNIADVSDDYDEINDQGYSGWSVFRGRKELLIVLSTEEI
ncbi:hypothetical protein GN958_ATG19913, partial [Phytophthora infestans]